MPRFLKSVIAFFVAAALIVLINTAVPDVKFLSSVWFMALIFTVSNYLIVYLTTKSRIIELVRKETREHIISGHGEVMEELDPEKLKNMDLLTEDESGRSFMNINGAIITTGYVTKERTVGMKKVIFPKVIYTVFSVIAMITVFSSFCQQSGFVLSDINTLEPSIENFAVTAEKSLKPAKKKVNTLKKGSAVLTESSAFRKESIREAFYGVIGKYEKGIVRIEKGAEFLAENIQRNYQTLLTYIENGGKNSV